MAERMICDRLIEVGNLPYNVKAIGFESADEISRIAHKFGKVVSPMKFDDIVKSLESKMYH